MGYRVSKSDYTFISGSWLVKEQRVDGSYNSSKFVLKTRKTIKPLLRYTLMACENRYQVGILSNLNTKLIKTISCRDEVIHP